MDFSLKLAASRFSFRWNDGVIQRGTCSEYDATYSFLPLW